MGTTSTVLRTRIRARIRTRIAYLAGAAATLCLACAPPAPAQTTAPSTPTDQQVLPDIGPSYGFNGTTTASDPLPNAPADTQRDAGPSHHSRPTAAAPFRIPHTFTKTTDSGVKFQFTLPRVGFRAGDPQMARSPLDSSGMSSPGARSGAIFPTDNSFLQPTSTASDNVFGDAPDASSDVPRSGHGGAGRGGGAAGGPGVSMKSSIFDLHVGLSMKDIMGGSFSQSGSGGNGAGSGSGFSMSGSNATDFSGGLHTPGSESRGGAGAKLTLGLRF